MIIHVLIGAVFVIIWQRFHFRISLNSVLLLLPVNFVCRLRLELIHIYICICIPHHKYQVKPHSPSWFSAAYAAAAAIVHTNQFFVNINRINFLSWKESSDRLVILTKGFLKLPNLDVLKKCCTSQKLGSQEFGKLLIVFSTKVNLLYLLYVFCIL